MLVTFVHAYRPDDSHPVFGGLLVLGSDEVPGFPGRRVYNAVVPASCEAFVKGKFREEREMGSFIQIEPIILDVKEVSLSNFFIPKTGKKTKLYEGFVHGRLTIDGIRELKIAAAIEAKTTTGFDLDEEGMIVVTHHLNVISTEGWNNLSTPEPVQVDTRPGGHAGARNPRSLGGQLDTHEYRIGHQWKGEDHVLYGTPKQLCDRIEELRAEGRASPSKNTAHYQSLVGNLVRGNNSSYGWYLLEIPGGYHWIPGAVKTVQYVEPVQDDGRLYSTIDGDSFIIDWNRLAKHVKEAV